MRQGSRLEGVRELRSAQQPLVHGSSALVACVSLVLCLRAAAPQDDHN